MDTDTARGIITKAMGPDRTFDNYIDFELAGDFACKIAGVLKSHASQQAIKARREPSGGCEQCADYHRQGMFCRNCGNTVPAA